MITRRRFLIGSSGVLALPMLESLARAQSTPAAPKRFVLFFSPHGTVFDRWKPAAPGPLGPTISDVMQPLAAVREHVTIISGIDNPSRHFIDNGDGHTPTNATIFTATSPGAVSGNVYTPSGPSIDQVVAQRLAGGAPRPYVLLPVSTQPPGFAVGHQMFYTPSSSGGLPTLAEPLRGDPRQVSETLFANLAPAPTPTLRERLLARRGSILDAVATELGVLRSRVSVRDRQRLDEHAAHIEALSVRGQASVPAASCAAPSFSLPDVVNDPTGGGRYDNLTAPAQIDNLVMSLACDLTRTGTLFFNIFHAPSFGWQYPAGQSVVTGTPYLNWHDMLHTGGADADAQTRVVNGFRFYSDMFTLLIQKLAGTEDVDGRTLLDNTLVLWMSDFGNGGRHMSTDIPVVLAGMPSQLQHGRYVQVPRHTNGDLFATVLQLLGESDTTFGRTGTLDTVHVGYFGNYAAGYPLHRGLLPL